MTIIEQSLTPKSPQRKSEDGIVVTPDFIAVIDGSTSKSSRRYSLFNSNGRLAMLRVARTLRRAPKDISLQQFCKEATKALRSKYRQRDLPYLAEHPEDRLAASAVIFSRLRRELWLIGDCHCLVTPPSPLTSHHSPLYISNPKPDESMLAEMRAAEVRRLLDNGVTIQQLLEEDTARPVIIPKMKECMKQQNVTYSVIDGFPIPLKHIRQIPLTFEPFELVLASDGYPFLLPTLAESEAALDRQRHEDPLNIGSFKATKAFMTGCNSFDDRAYIRFKV